MYHSSAGLVGLISTRPIVLVTLLKVAFWSTCLIMPLLRHPDSRSPYDNPSKTVNARIIEKDRYLGSEAFG